MVDSPAEAVRLSLRSASGVPFQSRGGGPEPRIACFQADEVESEPDQAAHGSFGRGPLEGREQWLEEWRAGRSFLDTLSCVFLRLCAVALPPGLTKNAVNAELLARLVRAGANLIKWDYLRYGPVERELWAFMGAAYLEAERTGMSQMLVSLRKDRGTQTSVEREYLRALARLRFARSTCARFDGDCRQTHPLHAADAPHFPTPGSGACFGLQIGAPAAPVQLPPVRQASSSATIFCQPEQAASVTN